jgi:AraC family transcriptional regulator
MSEATRSIVRPEPQIVSKPAFRVAGLRYEGRNQNNEIPQLWDKQFLPRLRELATLRVGSDLYGVCRELPNLPPDAGFEYLACAEVKTFEGLPPGMVGWDIPALEYAMLPAHDVADIPPVCDYFYSQWLPRSAEFAMGAGPMLEVYPPSFEYDFIIQMYFPVRRK